MIIPNAIPSQEMFMKFKVPMRISEPRIPQYWGQILVIEVRIDTPASVKKKFQCTPYSPT